MSKRVLAILALTTATTMWGLAFVATKVAVNEIPPLTLALVRFAIASAIIVPVARYQWRRTPERVPLPLGMLALLGLTGVTLFYATFNLGMARTSATNGSLIHATMPASIALLSAAMLREPLSIGGGMGIAISIVGVLVVSMAGNTNISGGSTIGDAFIIASVLAWSIFTVLGKKISQRIPGVVTTAYTSLFGMLFLVPLAGYEAATTGIGQITPLGVLALAYLALAASAASYLLWTFSLSQLSANQVGVFLNLAPVVGVGGAVALLGEPLLPLQIVGGALVLFGVYLANR